MPDFTGFGDKGPDADLPGFDITAYWARSGLLSLTRDAGAPPTWPVAGSGDHATAVGLVLGDRHRPVPAGAHGQGILCHDIAPGRRRVGRQRLDPGRLSGGEVLPAARSADPAERDDQRISDLRRHLVRAGRHAGQVGRAGDGNRPRGSAVGCAFLRCSEASREFGQLTAILDEVFASQPMSHWAEIFERDHLPFGVVRSPSEIVNDPQLVANDIVVPLEGAGGNLKSTISSPDSSARRGQGWCASAPRKSENTTMRNSQRARVRCEGDRRPARDGAIPKAKEAAAVR